MSNSLPRGRISLVTLSDCPPDIIFEVRFSPKVDKSKFLKFSNGYISWNIIGRPETCSPVPPAYSGDAIYQILGINSQPFAL